MDNNTQAVRRTLGVLFLAASFATAACSSPEAGSATPTPILQTIPEGQFTAEFPSAPIRDEERATSNGFDLTIISFQAETAKDTVGISYVDYPKGAKGSLIASAEATASSMNGTIQSKTETTFMGHPAMDVVVKTPDGLLFERLVLRGNRLYTLIGIGADPGTPPSYSRLVETFVLL